MHTRKDICCRGMMEMMEIPTGTQAGMRSLGVSNWGLWAFWVKVFRVICTKIFFCPFCFTFQAF
jgi:hypothetical protein